MANKFPRQIMCNKQQGSQLASCRAVCCAGFHVVTSTTHGVHMDTTWHPCGNPVVSCRNHIVSTFETLCCPPGNHIVSTWKPNGVHLETTWCAHGNHIISTWQPVVCIETTWCPRGNHVVATWKQCGFHMEIM